MPEYSAHPVSVSGNLEDGPDKRPSNATATPVKVKDEFVPEALNDVDKDDILQITQNNTRTIQTGEIVQSNDRALGSESLLDSSAKCDALLIKEEDIEDAEEIAQTSIGDYLQDSFEHIEDSQQYGTLVQLTVSHKEANENCDSELESKACVLTPHSETAVVKVESLSCSYCFAEFATGSEMQRHLSLHIGEQLSINAPNIATSKTKVDVTLSPDPLLTKVQEICNEKELTETSVSDSTVPSKKQKVAAHASVGSTSALQCEKQKDLKDDISSPRSHPRLTEEEEMNREERTQTPVCSFSTVSTENCKEEAQASIGGSSTALVDFEDFEDAISVHTMIKKNHSDADSRVYVFSSYSESADTQAQSCGTSMKVGCDPPINVSKEPSSGLLNSAAFQANSSNRQQSAPINSGNGQFSCTQYAASFTTVDKLQQERVVIHPGQKLFPCVVCGAAFLTEDMLHKHLTIHPGQKLFPCTQCKAAYMSKSNLKRHLISHSTKKAHDMRR